MLLYPSPSPTAPPPTSSPSKTPPLPLPPPLPFRRPHSPLPPPPPFPPPVCAQRFIPPPLPPPPPCAAIRMPGAGAGTQASSAVPARAFPCPGGSRSANGESFVEHLAPGRGVSLTPPGRGVSVTPPARGDGDVPGKDDDLAGVPPELLPPRKRIARYHPYAAAWAIQEMSTHCGAAAGGGFPLGAAPPETTEDGLRAELLRLRITRPALVLTKPLTLSDRSRDKARLVLPDGLVAPSPLLGMLTAAERRLVFGAGLPVPAFDRLGRAYRMALRRDPSARTYRLTGHWSLFVARHGMRAGDAVEVHAFRPPAWQARLDKHGEGGLGMALLHRRGAGDGGRRGNYSWCSREREAADGLLLIAGA